ncbi:hypothetical protein AB8U03_01045 [Clostridium sp. Mt-5]|uniref:Tetratricopeptide repeat protein n=1 Tax=Clostridium moutaii TaxID=3240932 RepID=A0ABV4BKL8_9CLOT
MVLVLDADEIVKQFDRNSILEFCNCSDNQSKVGRLKKVNEYEHSYGKRRYIERISRLFNKNSFCYSGTIHEQVVRKNKINYDTSNIDITIDHIGYFREVLKRTNKIYRNILMLKEELIKDQKDPYINYQLGKSYFLEKNYKKAVLYFKRSILSVDNFNYEYAEDLVESYGYALLNLNKFSETVIIEKYKRYYLSSLEYNFILALIYMNNSKSQQVVKTFLHCTEFKDSIKEVG